MNARDLPPIPVLRLESTAPDNVALETWREVLSSALGPELPHSLLALWLYDDGVPVLLGPAALAEDRLVVPRPAPRLDERELARLEDILRRAGYSSALAVGVPLGGEDVGLILIADFPKDRYGAEQARFLRAAAEAIGPSLARVKRLRGVTSDRALEADPAAAHEAGSDAEFLAALGDALAAGPPKEFARRLSVALQPSLPHDRLAIVVRDPTLHDPYLLSGHEHGTLWGDPALVIPAAAFNAERVANGAPGFAVADTTDSPPAWPPGAAASPIRSVVGAALRGAGGTIGWLLAGSGQAGLHGDAGRERLESVAPLVAPRVEALLLAFQAQVLRSHVGVLRNVPASLARAAELFVTTAPFGAAFKLVAKEAASLLPFTRLELAVRIGTEDEVVMLAPGEARPPGELPVTSAAGTDLARVVRGEQAHALATGRPGAEVTGALIVPLRLVGRIIGALILHAAGPEGFNRSDAALAQQLADVMAPHVELLRRAGGLGGTVPAMPPSMRRPASYG
jgi:hypothetical protein